MWGRDITIPLFLVAGTELELTIPYARQYALLSSHFEATQEKTSRVERRINDHNARRGEITLYLDTLAQSGAVLTKFNRRLWNLTVHTVTVHGDRRLVFWFEEGQEFVWS